MTQQGNATNPGFDNPATQEQRARILREQERNINTRSAMTSVIDPSLAGRFAKEARHDFTVGKDEIVNYPRLPQGGPWGSGPQVGLEPPFDGDINFVEACGTQAEIERSIAEVAVGPTPSDSLAGLSPLPADDADLPIAGSATAASLSAAAQVPASYARQSGGADPALGSADPVAQIPGSATLAHPPATPVANTNAERLGRSCVAEGGPSFKSSWRRVG